MADISVSRMRNSELRALSYLLKMSLNRSTQSGSELTPDFRVCSSALLLCCLQVTLKYIISSDSFD